MGVAAAAAALDVVAARREVRGGAGREEGSLFIAGNVLLVLYRQELCGHAKVFRIICFFLDRSGKGVKAPG